MIEFHYSPITGLVWWEIEEPNYLEFSKKRKRNHE